MKQKFPFVKIPEEYKDLIGVPDEGTRMYRAFGSQEDMEEWFDAVTQICENEGSVSPGGAAGYTRVTRPAVHKRLKEGRLTGFLFHVVTNSKFLKNRKKLEEGGRPYVFIPVSECKAWAKELREKRNKLEAQKEAGGRGHESDRFMKAKGDWKKRIRKK